MEIKKYLAEFLGTFFLIATVIGSGIMGDNLSADNEAVATIREYDCNRSNSICHH